MVQRQLPKIPELLELMQFKKPELDGTKRRLEGALTIADLRTIEDSLGEKHGSLLAAPRLKPLIRAVEVFGFHLATVDLRQSSDQHERVIAELLATAQLEADYAGLDEDARCTLLLRLLRDARPLRVVGAEYGEHTGGELAIFEAALALRRSHGREDRKSVV